jgi:hypothetical protein
MVAPHWPDEQGRPIPTHPCPLWTRGRLAAKGFRMENLRLRFAKGPVIGGPMTGCYGEAGRRISTHHPRPGPDRSGPCRIPDRLRTTGRPLRNRHARAKALTRSPISFGKPAYPFPRSNAPGRIWRSLGSTRSRGSADASTDRRAWSLATSAFPSLPASNRTNRPPTSLAERSLMS